MGFAHAADAVFFDVLQEAAAAEAAGKHVFLTGHSLGGAVAQILAFRLYQSGLQVSGVHTFGSPAVGTVNWARSYDARLFEQTHRWVQESDPIACYPASQESWEQAGRAHVLRADSLAMDAVMTSCEDAFPGWTVDGRLPEPARPWQCQGRSCDRG